MGAQNKSQFVDVVTDFLIRKAQKQEAVNELALSAGGQWGAFGAAFLNSWQNNSSAFPKPAQFDIVTGVSTGAVMAAYAFLGNQPSENDRTYFSELDLEYRNIDDPDVFEERPLLFVPFSNSFLKTEPLREHLESRITEKVLDDIATLVGNPAGPPDRLLYVMSVNLDTVEPIFLPLWQVATQVSGPCRKKLFIDYIMSSAAIPIGFPPVFLDRRDDQYVPAGMYVDGGARLMLFFSEQIETAVANARLALQQILDAAKRRSSIEASRLQKQLDSNQLFILVNNDFHTEARCVGNDLINIATRTAHVILDQLARDSLEIVIRMAEARSRDPNSLFKWNVRFATARGHSCTYMPTNPFDTFDPEFMDCLAEHGASSASSKPDPWLMGVENVPKTEKPVPPVCTK
jgi:predicted acylesterase/phospholipase RssA